MKLKALSVVAATLFAAGAANAANLVTNGTFESITTPASGAASFEFGDTRAAGFTGAVAGWTSTTVAGANCSLNPVSCPKGLNGYNILFNQATALTVDPDARYTGGETQVLAALPSNSVALVGGASNHFVALDGDPAAQATLSQVITGLVVGQSYNLYFDWAADQFLDRTGNTTESLQVSLGGQTHTTWIQPDLSHSATPWIGTWMGFTATSTTETLSFLSLGTPSGLPPVALLDNVSLTVVPEPTSWALMIIGFGGVGAAMRSSRRRRAMVAA